MKVYENQEELRLVEDKRERKKKKRQLMRQAEQSEATGRRELTNYRFWERTCIFRNDHLTPLSLHVRDKKRKA